ncbi:hypothetical protein [Roseovarius indicus]|jgi:hypothetical protein|uniref:Uncharacterized protein n=1 Tax=Roseovarius indicus TaxID=540747 RepID=A0A0T5P867_9RHOB|nr:hypothetical protein [Roseovarius indicus]KRS17192.1 hypothetical protein XM52_14035 [Roseovarius indicus]OAO00831.1 hypothetical protein A8B76_20710 [Roseovarius indicus]QEW27570.1 hypothetical protein RIdsm_03386 [Roseovarius indicus]SFE35606.1 hypothetical protein SAMN04488031_108210 [Roseovarius indicus]
MAQHTHRRAILGWIGLFGLTGTAALAQPAEEFDPAELVPRRFSPEEFASLDANEIYMASLALRRGRRITIDGCSASDSAEVIRLAASDRSAGLQKMRSLCGG